MLHKSYITNIEIYTDEWRAFRVGKFTSSKIVEIMAEDDFTKGALSYIDQKAGEYLTQQNISMEDDDEIEDENTVWGKENEPKALMAFAEQMKIKFLVTQKVIHKPGSRFSSTPDAIHIINSAITKEDCYNVATVEAKCPRKYPRFMPLYRCKTPEDVKKISKKYYWQVLDQIDACSAAIGYFVVFHPLFPTGKNLRIIEFRKIDLWDDFGKLLKRKEMALNRFNEVLAEFMAPAA